MQRNHSRRSKLRRIFCAAGCLAFVVWAPPRSASAEGVSAGQRAATSLLESIAPVADSISAARDLQRLPSNTSLTGYLNSFRKETRKLHLEVAGYQTFQGIRDTALVMGGVPGTITAAAFRVTFDKFILDQKQHQMNRAEEILASQLRSLSASDWDNYRSNPGSTAAGARVRQTVEDLIRQQGQLGLSEAEQKALKGALDQSLANMTVDTWNRVHDLAKGQARTQADLSRLSKEVASVQDKVVQVGERVTELADSVNALGLELQKAAWDKLNPEQKREALAKGAALPWVDSKERSKVAAQINRDAVIYRAEQVTAKAAGAMEGLAVLANAVGNRQAAKAFKDLAKVAQQGQAAVSVFKAFAVGGPIGGLVAIGGMGSMFGGGPNADMASIRNQLKQMDAKLDTILSLQRQTLEKLNEISASIIRMEGKIDALAADVRANAAIQMRATFSGVYATCPDRVLTMRVWRDGKAVSLFPLLTVGDFVNAHFLDEVTYQSMVSPEGSDCFDGLWTLLSAPKFVATAGAAGSELDGTRRSAEAKFRGEVLFYESVLPPARRTLARHWAIEPPATISERVLMAAAVAKGSPPEQSCLWEIRPRCPQVDGGGPSPVSREQRLLLNRGLFEDEAPLMATMVLPLAEYALAMYIRPLLPEPNRSHLEMRVVQGKPMRTFLAYEEAIRETASAIEAKMRSGSPAARKQRRDARALLEHAARVSDIAIANEATAEGFSAIEFLVDRVMAPPKLASTAPAAADAQPTPCGTSSTLGEGFLGAETEAIFWERPQLAERVLNAVQVRLGLFNGAQLDKVDFPSDLERKLRLALYQYHFMTPPLAWDKAELIYAARQTEARAQRYWFGGQWRADDGPLVSHVRVFYTRPGEKRTIKLYPLERKRTAPPAQLTASHCVLRTPNRTAEDDAGKTGEWLERHATAYEVTLSEGWSFVLGPAVVSPMAPGMLLEARDPLPRLLAQLVDTRAAIREELASFYPNTSPPAELRPLLTAGIKRQVRALREIPPKSGD